MYVVIEVFFWCSGVVIKISSRCTLRDKVLHGRLKEEKKYLLLTAFNKKRTIVSFSQFCRLNKKYHGQHCIYNIGTGAGKNE